MVAGKNFSRNLPLVDSYNTYDKRFSILCTDQIIGDAAEQRQIIKDINLEKRTNLHQVSPAELLYLCVNSIHGRMFPGSSRTSTDIVYMPKDSKIALIKNSQLSNEFISDIVSAHSDCKEFTISLDKMDLVRKIVDRAVSDGSGILVDPVFYNVPIKDLNLNPITNFLFSDKKLGIDARDYSKNDSNIRNEKIRIYLDDLEIMRLQKNDYLNTFTFGNNGSVKQNDFIFDIDGVTKNSAYSYMRTFAVQIKRQERITLE